MQDPQKVHFGGLRLTFSVSSQESIVDLTPGLSKSFKTKRYKKLQKEFHHWYKMRQEALKCEDPAKAKLLAKNMVHR
jgi:hypothetical protein